MIPMEYDNSPVLSDLLSATVEAVEDTECPEGGDTANDCSDCAYSADYHCVGGCCIRRY